MEREHSALEAAISAKEEMLAQTTIDIQELENLAGELLARLHRTSFESKSAGITDMVASFCQDIVCKYFGIEGTNSREVVVIALRPARCSLI